MLLKSLSTFTLEKNLKTFIYITNYLKNLPIPPIKTLTFLLSCTSGNAITNAPAAVIRLEATNSLLHLPCFVNVELDDDKLFLPCTKVSKRTEHFLVSVLVSFAKTLEQCKNFW